MSRASKLQKLNLMSPISLRKQSGQSLVQVMIAVAISGILMLAILSMTSILSKQQQQSTLTAQASEIRNTLGLLINSPGSWKQTYSSAKNNLASHSGLDCLISPGKPCTTDGSTDLPLGTPISGFPINAVLDASGTPFYDATDPAAGFTPQGTLCNNFSATTGNDSCPLRFNISWQAVCSAGPPATCVNPQPKITVTAVYNPKSKSLVFNPLNYSLTGFFQGALGSSPCWNFSGGNLIDTCPGNVGIGTAMPASKFQVAGSITTESLKTNQLLTIDNSSGNYTSIQSSPMGGETIGNLALNPVSGYVGIGTNRPQYALDVWSAPNPVIGNASLVSITATNALGSPGLVLNNFGAGNGQSFFGLASRGAAYAFPDNAGDTVISSTSGALQLATGVGDATHPNTRVTVALNGNVGLGVFAPNYQLHLAKDSAAKPGSGNWTVASDPRLKDIRAPFSRGLSAIEEIKPIYFNYKKNNPLALPSDTEYVGANAKEVQRSIPEAISTDEKGYLHLTNDAVIWTMLNSIKELNLKLKEATKQNELLKSYLCSRDPGAPICTE